jgi:hypothetical protein
VNRLFAASNTSIGGSSAARFRFSSVGNLAPGGAAADGEVEDYLAVVVPGSTTARLDIEVPGGDTNVAIDGDNLVVRKGTTIISQVPFAGFGNLNLNGSSLDDIFELTILEALASKTLEFDGGIGKDLLKLLESGRTLDLTSANVTVRDVEVIDITGTGNNKLVVSIDAVKAASSTTDTLEVISNAGDTIAFGNGWKAETPKFINGQFTHVISEATAGGTARVEIRNNRPLTNPLTPFDADRDGKIQPLDALRIINELSRRGAGAVVIPTNDAQVNRLYFDVSGDMQFTPLDALRVINALSRINRGLPASGESMSAFVLAANDQTPVQLDSDLVPVEPSSEMIGTKRLSQRFESPESADSTVAAVDELFFEYGADEEEGESTLRLLSAGV